MRAAIGYSLRLSLRVRWVLLCIVAAFVYALGTVGEDVFPPGIPVAGNVWDVVFNTLSQRPVTLIWAPIFLLVTMRDLTHPSESLVVTRLGRREQWWLSDIIAIGCQAVAYVIGVTCASWLVGGFLGSFGSRWSALDLYAEKPHVQRFVVLAMQPLQGMSPAVAALGSVVLLVLLLWAIGVLAHAVALVARSPWTGMISVEAILLLALLFIGQWVRWFPAGQFVLADHWNHGSFTGVPWSVAYGFVLLTAAAWIGMCLTLRETWSRE